MNHLQITEILTVAEDIPPTYPQFFSYKIIPLDDDIESDLFSHFDDSFNFIHSHLSAGRNVLVHWFVFFFFIYFYLISILLIIIIINK